MDTKGLLFVFLLTLISIEDCKTRKILSIYSFLISVLALTDFKVVNLLGLLIPLIVLICCSFFEEEKFGGGDIKLIISVSLLLGFYKTAVGVVLALLLFLIYFLVLSFNMSRQEVKKFSSPLAPFFEIGFVFAYYFI